MKLRNNGSIALVLIAGLGIIAFFIILIFAPYTMVGPGDVGVISTMGKIDPDPLPSGFHVVGPMASVHKFDVKVQIASHDYEAASKDLQLVNVRMIINYHVTQPLVPFLFKEVGEDYFNKIVLPAGSEVLKAEIALHNATEILENRAVIKKIIEAGMAAWPLLKKYGVVIDEISLSNISFSKEYEQAIERKQLQEQATKQKEYELQQTKIAASMQVAAAQGAADSKRLEADAMAYYNDKTAKALTSELLQMKYYEKWDGKLPQYILGNSPILMSMPGAK